MYFMCQMIIVMFWFIEYDMCKEIFQKYEDFSMVFYKCNKIGDMMLCIIEDVLKVRMYFGLVVLYGINLVLFFVFVIYFMLSVNVELIFYVFVFLFILFVLIYYVSNLINKKSEIIQWQLVYLNMNVQEIYFGIWVVKFYVQEKLMLFFF